MVIKVLCFLLHHMHVYEERVEPQVEHLLLRGRKGGEGGRGEGRGGEGIKGHYITYIIPIGEI